MVKPQKKNDVGCTVPIGWILLIVFVVLKLTGTIDWSWWWVLSPIWISWALLIILWIIGGAIGHIILSINKK